MEHLFITLLLVAGAVVAGWYLNRTVVISNIRVEGNQMTHTREILETSSVKEGMHADSIRYLEIISRVEALPWVEKAHITVSPSGQMRIRIEEAEPLALLRDRNRSAWVTASGIQLPVILGTEVDVPVLYGFRISDRQDTLVSGEFSTARDFLLAARKYPEVYSAIGEVMVTADEGVVVLTAENAVRVTLGHDQFDDRLRTWRAFQSQVISEKGITAMQSIDFRYRGQVVTRE